MDMYFSTNYAFHCLAKVLWTGQTKHSKMSFRPCSVCPPWYTHIVVTGELSTCVWFGRVLYLCPPHEFFSGTPSALFLRGASYTVAENDSSNVNCCNSSADPDLGFCWSTSGLSACRSHSAFFVSRCLLILWLVLRIKTPSDRRGHRISTPLVIHSKQKVGRG